MLRLRIAHAFTLIELLIVVAIIAILAAIAVPNFLEAQTRSKVSRIKADMRSQATAVESYAVDNNGYPWGVIQGYNPREQHNWGFMPECLTTPIGYITSLTVDLFGPFYKTGQLSPPDIFGDTPADSPHARFRFEQRRGWPGARDSGSADPAAHTPGFEARLASMGLSRSTSYIICSPGPDNTEDVVPPYNPLLYDATNGTVSRGDVIYLGGSGLPGR